MSDKVISYTVRQAMNSSYLIWEHQNGSPVNEYTAFMRGDQFVLYPKRRIIPSTIDLNKKTISIFQTRRAY